MFSIVGRCGPQIVSVTRSQPSGATLLAEDWMRRGFADVRIDWHGHSYTPGGFRHQFVLTREGLVQRSRALNEGFVELASIETTPAETHQ